MRSRSSRLVQGRVSAYLCQCGSQSGLFLSCFAPDFLRQDLSQNLELTHSVRIGGWGWGGIASPGLGLQRQVPLHLVFLHGLWRIEPRSSLSPCAFLVEWFLTEADLLLRRKLVLVQIGFWLSLLVGMLLASSKQRRGSF